MLIFPAASFAEISLGYSQDAWNARGTGAGIARYDHLPTRLGAQAMYWKVEGESTYALALDYDVLPSEFLDLNLGAVYIDDRTYINGTHFNFSIGAGVNLWERLSLQFTHFSNAHRENNEGWNFLGVMLRL